MRAAIYCRKSTTDKRGDTEKSVAHQERECRKLIEERGWSLDPARIYVDDGVSGALFGEARPSFHRMMNDILDGAKAKRLPFEVLVTLHEDRLGRDQVRTTYSVVEILDAGIRLFFANGEERVINNETDTFLLSAKNYASGVERARARERVTGRMREKAKLGHSTGLTPFGYKSVEQGDHRVLVIDPRRAEIVRRIFTLSAEGNGISRISATLNKEHPGLRKWSAPTVRDILANTIYNGIVTYGKKRFEIRGGKRRKVVIPESEWIKVERPELRIVSPQLWDAVQARMREMYQTYLRDAKGLLQGRPEQGSVISRHLLSSFVVCSECGGKMVVWSPSTRPERGSRLRCWKHRTGTCSNGTAIDLDELTGAIVHHLKSEVLTFERLMQVQQDLAADAANAPEKVAARRTALEAEARQVSQKLQRLVAAIADGGSAKTLVQAIKATEQEQQRIEAQIKGLDATVRAADGNDDGWGKVRALLVAWSAALEGNTAAGRQVLRKILTGPIKVTPLPGGGYSYEAPGTFNRIFSGILGVDEPRVFPTGSAHEDDLRAELKAIAERVQAMGHQEALDAFKTGLQQPQKPRRRPSKAGGRPCRA